MATSTPNIGLQIPALNQANWQVPTNFNWNLLDLIFGGEVTVPALSVLNFTIANFAAAFNTAMVQEAPSGAVPGSIYVASQPIGALLGVYVNGLLQRLTTDYSVSGSTVTLTSATSSGDKVYLVYLHA